MSDNNLISEKNGLSFPLVIAITALILSLTSGVVNYRQNNLSNLESSLRDTRDQLQLAKNDITDIRMNTVQQLVDAELALKNQAELKYTNKRLTEKLQESKIRMGELERQIKRMDHRISKQSYALKAAKRKAAASHAQKKKTTTSNPVAVNNGITNTSANVDIYIKNMSSTLQNSIIDRVRSKGFSPTFPKLLDSMDLSKQTTVFYYNETYKQVARNLANIFMASSNGEVILRKGVSPYAANKIIVHLIGQ